MVQTRRSKRNNQPQAVEDIVAAVEKPIGKVELIEKIDEKKNSDALTLGCTDIKKKSTGIDLSAVEKEVVISSDVILDKSIDNNEKKSTTDIKLGVAEKSTNSDSNIKKEDWRIKAEERRQAALAIWAAKKLKTEQQQNSGIGSDKKNHQHSIVTPVTNPYSSSKKSSNPYKKKVVSSPYAAKSTTASTITTTTTTQINSPQSDIKPRKLPAAKVVQQQLPKVTSTWGDCRLDLWEETCRCGGERKAPDTRMCSCPAVYNAGLSCNGCNTGVLLIKGGPPRGFFWGCSQYKKRGCNYTKRFGPPHDAAAAQQLAELKQDSIAELKQDSISKAKQEREERA